MIQTIRQACRFNPAIQDYRMSQGIENLADLINDAGDGREFFARNFVTHGTEQLSREGLLRLSGKSDQAVFELTQAMGGGKTHLMIALGLLARHPHLRPEILPADLNGRIDFGQARMAAVNVSVVGVHPETGATILSLTPRHAGESPAVYCATKPERSDQDQRVDDLDNFSTDEGTLYFWVKDPTGQFESGPAVRWLADFKIRHQVDPAADRRRVTLACTPRADLFYTLDGSNPKDGAPYAGPFEIGPQAARLLVYARAGEANKTADFQVPASGDQTARVVDAKPARLLAKGVALDTTDRVYGVINRFRDQPGTRFKGVRIEIGEGENTVTVCFQEALVHK